MVAAGAKKQHATLSADRIDSKSDRNKVCEGKTNGAFLKWSNLSVTVKGRPLLNNISGNAKPGRILAILGASGAGKSTLLTSLVGLLGPQYSTLGEVKCKRELLLLLKEKRVLLQKKPPFS